MQKTNSYNNMQRLVTNIDDLGFIYFSVGKENAPYMNRSIDNKLSGNSFLGGCNFFLRFFYYLFHSPLRYDKRLKKANAVMVYGESTNNRNTLLPIINKLGDEELIDIHGQKQYPKWKQYWYALPHLGKLVKEIRRSNQDRKEIIRYFFAKFWVMYGCNKAAGELLDYYKPRMLVMANDHLHFNRSLLREANRRGIPTMYVQHAAVTDRFPALSFTYSLLDGEDSYSKYKMREETCGNIYLSGGIRFDAINGVEKQKEGGTIVGVAINQIDEEAIVKNVCLQLKEINVNGRSVKVVLRPHPQMELDAWKEWCVNNDIGFSVAKIESSFQFLSRISVLVSDQSSIHLDAAMCHTPSVVYSFSSVEQEDFYSFVKNGLTVKANDIDSLATFIANSTEYNVPQKAVKYYNCSYGTNYEGDVATMMADLIKSIKCDSTEDFNKRYGFELIESTENRKVYKVS